MKDSDVIIVKAFLAALTQLSEPLPVTLQQQLQTLSKTQKFPQLVVLARQHEPLKLAYQQANTLLIQQGNQQRMGLDTIPDASWQKENTASLSLDNTSKKIGDSIPLTDILLNIEKGLNDEDLVQMAKQVCQSSDSVEEAKVALFGYIQIA